ncbi:MAG: hypothetical protein ACEQSQ_06095 [Candidatus Paceibacteria bacterium]
MEWNSEKGQFKYYDKETKENVDIPLPVKFYVLDELATIKGFSDKHQSGLWSNEVKNITTQKLKVVGKDKSGKLFTVAEGFYQSIKDTLAANGAKYTRSLYAAMLNDKDEYEIVNFQLKGAAFSGWLDFCNAKKVSIMTDEITCSDFKREKKGATKYTIPIFTSELASEEGNEAAITLDEELQEYLKAYFEKTQAEVEYVDDKVTKGSKTTRTEDFDEDDENDLPF